MNPEDAPRAGSTAPEPSGKPSQDLDIDADDQHPVALDTAFSGLRPPRPCCILRTRVSEKNSPQASSLLSL